MKLSRRWGTRLYGGPQDDDVGGDAVAGAKRTAALWGAAVVVGGPIQLEVEATAELDGARGIGVVAKGEAGDVSECSAANGYVGIADEFGVVNQIERFDPNLELAFTPHLDATSDACVYVGNAGSAEFVAAGVAKGWRNHARGN